MKRLLFAISLFALPMGAMAQTRTVTGRIVDSKGAPIEAVTVVAQTMDSVFVDAAVTDSEGRFSIKDAPGEYRLLLQHLLFATRQVEGNSSDIGTLAMEEEDRVLDDVVVKGKKTFTRQTSTGFLYDLSGIEFVKGQNLFQALRLVPFIDINREGEISVKGGQAVRHVFEREAVRHRDVQPGPDPPEHPGEGCQEDRGRHGAGFPLRQQHPRDKHNHVAPFAGRGLCQRVGEVRDEPQRQCGRVLPRQEGACRFFLLVQLRLRGATGPADLAVGHGERAFDRFGRRGGWQLAHARVAGVGLLARGFPQCRLCRRLRADKR